MSAILRALPCMVLCFLGLLAAAPTALAHAQLHGAEPAAGAVLEAAPAEVVLRFNEAIGPLQANWVLPDGTVTAAEATARGVALHVAAPADLPDGTHALSWRVVSADGHPVGGTHVFSIGAPSAAPEIAASLPPWPAALARGLLTLALAFGVGGALWAALSRQPVPGARAAAVAVLPAALILLAAQAMDLTGAGAAALAAPAAWGLAAASPLGASAGLAAAAGLVAARARGRMAPALAAWALAAGSFAVAGHAARAEPVALMAPLVFLHAAALIFWAGALPGLLGTLRAPDAAARMARFSRLALPAVALLALSGAALAWRQIGTPAALTGTAYGQVFLAKMALVAAVLLLAARHRVRLTPALATSPQATRPAFACSLRLEIAVLVAILALTAGFRLTPPPRALAALPEAQVALHLHGRDAMADILVIPGRPGPNRIEIQPLDGDFQPSTPLEITLSLSRPADGIEPIALRAEPGPDGLWHAGPAHLPPGGDWDIVADILITDFRKELIGGTLTLLP
ncbi:MAG: copper resistance CopC/CopD family protein [Alkalilacustris sp.]